MSGVLSLTRGRSGRTIRRAAWQAVAVSFGVITAFAFFGQQILNYLHVSLPALQCAGGCSCSSSRSSC